MSPERTCTVLVPGIAHDRVTRRTYKTEIECGAQIVRATFDVYRCENGHPADAE